jgi:hypothetical protein
MRYDTRGYLFYLQACRKIDTGSGYRSESSILSESGSSRAPLLRSTALHGSTFSLQSSILYFNADPDPSSQNNAETDTHLCLFWWIIFPACLSRQTLELLIMWRAHTCRSPPSWLGRRMRGEGAGCPPPPASTPPRTPRRPRWQPSRRHLATWTSTGTQWSASLMRYRSAESNSCL